MGSLVLLSGHGFPAETLKEIVYDTLNFDVPLVPVKENIYSLELFHGPTLAFNIFSRSINWFSTLRDARICSRVRVFFFLRDSRSDVFWNGLMVHQPFQPGVPDDVLKYAYKSLSLFRSILSKIRAAAKRSIKGTSVNIMDKLAAKRGIALTP